MKSEQIITILVSAGVVAGVGLLIGLFLGLSGKFLAVPTDQRVEQIRACLPGNNCGGCGHSGCDALARAIANGEAALGAFRLIEQVGAKVAGLGTVIAKAFQPGMQKLRDAGYRVEALAPVSRMAENLIEFE